MLKNLMLLLVIFSVAYSASIDFTVQNQSCPDNANFLQVIFNLPTCIVERFFSSLVSGFVYSAKEFLENSLNFIVTGPNLDLFCTPYTQIMRILESLYTLALMGVGAYYIATSADVEKRAKAKLWIQNLLYLIVVLAFSFSIFKMIVELNQYITTSIYDTSFSNLLSIQVVFSSLVFAMVLSFNFLSAAALTFFTLITRYLMIPFLLLLFPIAIFLYFMPFTRDWGLFLLKFIVIIIFMTSIDAVLILGLTYLFNSGDPALAGGFVQGIALMLGFGLIGFVNVLIYLIAVFSLVSVVLRVLNAAVSVGWKVAMLLALL